MPQGLILSRRLACNASGAPSFFADVTISAYAMHSSSGVVVPCKDRQGSVIETLYLSDYLCSVLGRYPHAIFDGLYMRRVCKDKNRSKDQG